jgi:hypothetical protein
MAQLRDGYLVQSPHMRGRTGVVEIWAKGIPDHVDNSNSRVQANLVSRQLVVALFQTSVIEPQRIQKSD